jgi:hypothetical protein
MNVTLRNDDALAVDLLLDRSSVASGGDGNGNGNGGSGLFVSAADGVSPERVHAAERVLGLLALMPADEPAGDLLARTLSRLERHEAVRVGRPVVDPLVHSPHPHA